MSHERLRGAVHADTGLPQHVDETLMSLVDADADPRWPGAVWDSIDETTPSLAGDNVTVRTTRRFVRCFEACCDDFPDGDCEEAHRRRFRFQPHQRPLLMRFCSSHRPLLTYEWPAEGAPPGREVGRGLCGDEPEGAPPGREVGRRPRGVKWTTPAVVDAASVAVATRVGVSRPSATESCPRCNVAPPSGSGPCKCSAD